ncbi:MULTISPECIES: SURF1 family protein [Methylobacterium]|uniref:SURF1-like protein n=1 Tax=Methylobacterium thuringiense TaxID=1003091 RepID=A0ABQ4TSM0_9HYPH|nr:MULTISPECIES: SURF1 family protein [Methylobacterium]TXN22315.1 SURF1 family protein [Methylobacterium sp. WL9]GJE57879.1 hypothetical protein EKPJFOCH_4401 [Methylobacterium thuringiense]
MNVIGASKSPSRWRGLIAPGIASAVSLAILIGLGIWQIERKGEKEALIGHIIERSHAEPPAALPAADAWDPKTDEFRRVRVTGTLKNDKETLVHGLAAGDVPGRALQGFYVITPLVRTDGSTVLVNRGFIPTELKNPADRQAGQVAGETTLTGILRATEVRTMFVPAADPARGEWFNRDIAGIAAAKGLGAVPPYLIEADATPNPGGWPKGGQLRVDLPNNHLQYAFTWFGIAACLVGVFSVFAWRKLNDPPEASAG